ncbi:MAG TPA: DMT family transporter [Noviherbaspirillum sp.]
MNTGISFALLAAALFGASTPLAKLLMDGQTPPLLLAGMLYLGSGIGLSLWIALRVLRPSAGQKVASISASELPWLAGAVLTGGILGPILLMTGLNMVSAASASLLLNMEGVLTTLLAWFVFRESFDRRIFVGMLFIVAAGALLSWDSHAASPGLSWGALSIVAACLCWAIDNNLTRKISASDPVQIAAIKGLVAGAVNLGVALAWLGMSLPDMQYVAAAGVIGFGSYGLSLVLFVLALRHLGTARTGAYFSAAPFVGAAIAMILLDERPNAFFWIAAGLMLTGIWLHLTERHAHAHTHERMSHTHAHRHDAHHQHQHDFAWNGEEPHTHVHVHEPLTHTHAHFPDIHHRHSHAREK